MSKLPERINVIKTVSYDPIKIAQDLRDMGQEGEITLPMVLDYLEGWIEEDFGADSELIYQDENGEELL